jgi:REP element-mobilizing transposase RayT
MKEIIIRAKQKENIQIYAYCMMPNHLHLFLKEIETGTVSLFMKRILSHYAGWYNFKYERVGHLFANRYKSIPVEDDSYLITLSKYIHQNPVKSGMAEHPEDYPFSSYSDYVENNSELTDVDFLLDVFDEDRKTAISKFVCHINSSEEDFDYEESIRNRDIFTRLKIVTATRGIKPLEIAKLPKAERNELLKDLMNNHGIQKVALSRLTGISRSTLSRLVSSKNS